MIAKGKTMRGDNQWGGQPSGQSGPYGPSRQPAVPSQRVYGYPGRPSQPMYGQPGPYSQPAWGFPGAPSDAMMTPPHKRPPLWLWITIGGVVAVLILGGIGAFVALSLYGAPGAAATQFCTDLKTQNYDSAYHMFSAKLQATYTSDQFHQTNGVLDTVEGKVTSCGSGAYDYSLGSDTATVGAVITREKLGNLQGVLHLISQGSWKVDGLDTSLLGINLGALQTLNAFCAAEQSQNYDAVYDLLGPELSAQTPKAEYVAFATIQELIDGKVTACSLTSVANGNTDATTTVTITVTRETRGTSSGAVTLDSVVGNWKISKIDDAVRGTDPQPLLVGTELCLYVAAGQNTLAYALTSAQYQRTHTLAQFRQYFASHLPAGGKWLLGEPDLMTYKVTANTAQYSGAFGYTDASPLPKGVPMTLALVLESGSWKVDAITLSRS